MIHTLISPRIVLRVVTAVLLTALAAAVLADCGASSGSGGMYQGGGDSAPRFRR